MYLEDILYNKNNTGFVPITNLQWSGANQQYYFQIQFKKLFQGNMLLQNWRADERLIESQKQVSVFVITCELKEIELS